MNKVAVTFVIVVISLAVIIQLDFSAENIDNSEILLSRLKHLINNGEVDYAENEFVKLDCDTIHFDVESTNILDFLKEHNIPRTIATMSEWCNVEFYIREFKLEQWFDIDKIVYSDGSIPGKPAPDIFLIAAEKIDLLPRDCLVIEDAIAGIKSAKAAGIGKIYAIASMEPDEFYQNINGVDKIIHNFDEIDRNIFTSYALGSL